MLIQRSLNLITAIAMMVTGIATALIWNLGVLQIILYKVLLIARVKISRYRSTTNFS